ncbi:carbohydrate-responsive element-binding protein [Chanos chanos]|uniref:Carbohydrate-responsive element-binding protein n=1 Tax=Chanos chanos TaxID=29144 RepID=A0A6J2WVL9_CHACN|nr:carbohydrate-responsive element-binding protein-like [Chanos chanos]
MAKIEKISPEFCEPTQPNQIPDSESDSDPDDHLTNVDSGPSSGSVRHTQVIHSGHFMVSSPHSDSTPRRRKSGAMASYDFDSVNKPDCQTYKFGPLSSGSLSIDPTLTRLFECMTLAYSGKIVSPKWKSFKGLRLLWRDKIRLNNGIWRAWFIQYVEKRKSPFCGFITPLEGSEADAHHKPEAIVLEGSYWKRRIEVVIKEYHKWRIYYKKRLQKNKDLLSMLQKRPVCGVGLEKWSNQVYEVQDPTPEEAHMFDLDCFLSDISDTLFTMTQKPCSWSGERHNTYTSNADMIQPGLTPLQPNLDDFMDIPDIFSSYLSGQSVEQTGFTDSGWFESPSTGPYPSTAGVTAPLIHTGPQVTQPGLLADSLSQPTTSDALPGPDYHHRQPLTPELTFNPSGMTSEPKFKGHQEYSPHSEFQHHLVLGSGVTPYAQQSYSNPDVAMASSNMGAVPQGNPYLYQTSCHKYRSSPVSGTSSTGMPPSVITHTGSAISVLPHEPQTQGYPSVDDLYPPTTCISLGYPAVTAPPSQSTLPSPSLPHCFSVPQQTGVAAGRGKHKQKMGGAGSRPGATPTPSAMPQPTSCLAKLLSSSAQERKPSLGFDPPLAGMKDHRPTSPISPSSSGVAVGPGGSQMSLGVPWPSPGVPSLTPAGSQTSLLAHSGPHAGTSRDSAVSALLSQNTPLLVPKTEKLSPVQIYGTEKNALKVSFSESSGQTSPTNPSERKSSKPDSPHSLLGQAKTEPHRTDTRRITHISAEQKRRFNIKLGFDTLHSLVTTLSSQPSVKISKATTLQKTVEYISKMQQERAQLQEEAQRLRDEILMLNSAINVCQQQLPATGVPITRQRFDHMRERFREYVRAQTLQNWKFWIFSVIMEPLFESYNGMVSTASVEDLCRTTLSWLEQHCSLPALRPMVLSSLRLLCTSTSILTDPSLVPEQATQAVTQSVAQHSYTQ